MTEVSAISTICKNCLFAIYDDDTQIGCHFGRTDKVDNHDVYDICRAPAGALQISKVKKDCLKL